MWTTRSETDLALIAARPEVQGRPPVVRRDPLHVFDHEVESAAPTGDSGVSLAVASLARAHPALERPALGSNSSAGITLVALAAFMVSLPYDSQVGPSVRAGLFGRFLLISYLGWLITVAVHTRKLHRDGGAAPRSRPG